MVEIWKNIKEYEKYYQVSNFGRVKRLKRIIKHSKSGNCILKEKILKGNINNLGYPRVTLYVNKKSKEIHIHRLVGFAFVDGYFTGAIINHKDCDKSNNNSYNLEWTNKSGNQKHAIKNGLFKPPVFFGKNNHNSKKVIDTKTNMIYNCVREASQQIGVSQSYLSQMLRGDRINKTTLKYISTGELSEVDKIIKSVK